MITPNVAGFHFRVVETPDSVMGVDTPGVVIMGVDTHVSVVVVETPESGAPEAGVSTTIPSPSLISVLFIMIIPWKWFGITTNAPNWTKRKCTGISIQYFSAIFPMSDNFISPLIILPKKHTLF